ncbi:MAG: hypothetical protein C5B55_03885 [Blastocatellia bacterium]|nr:MAG: hypothetical protein C5B55_03885 [Blastocatellia bacterium]
MVWESTVNGRQLHFHLAGINNQNFIMRDEETGTWWQQVSGEAIVGPLKGQRLRSVLHDEITFKMWKQEQPRGRVLKPDPTVDAKNYVPADWDTRMEKVPVRIAQDLDPKLSPRTLVVGVVAGNVAKAYPSEVVAKQSPIVDELGGVPLLIVAGNDRKSVRGFERVIDGRVLEFFKKKDSSPLVLVDSQTGSEWDFTGKAISGPLTGKQIKQIFVLNDYWFDWKNYHPKTSVYDAGL